MPHLSKEQGELVKEGEVIATVGNTGEFTTGHIYISNYGVMAIPINPTNFIDFD